MIEHEHDYIIVETQGDKWIKQCSVCSHRIEVDKPNNGVKKPLLKRLFGRW